VKTVYSIEYRVSSEEKKRNASFGLRVTNAVISDKW